MLLLARIQKEGRLTGHQFKLAALSGALMVVANGIVCFVEEWVPSGMAAVIIGAMPIWVLFISWLCFGDHRPNLRKFVGSVVGLAGVAVIAFGQEPDGGAATPFKGPLLLVASSWLWAVGTLLQRQLVGLKSPLRFAGTQMLCGAVLATILSFSLESPWTLDLHAVSLTSYLALAYLVIFGSIVAFSAYSWLSRNVEPHLVSSYALVNPVIAVALGSALANEPVTQAFVSGTVLVLAGLALLMLKLKRPVVTT